MKKWLGALLTVLVLMFIVYIARVPLTIAVVERLFATDDLEMTCLDWHISDIDKITAPEVCITSPQVSARLSDVKLSWQAIDIEAMTLAIKSANNSAATPPQALSLPLDVTRPLLSINSLSVTAEPLPAPITVAVEEVAANQFRLQGDVHAEITLSTNAIDAEIDLSSEAIQKQLPSAISQLSGQLNTTYRDAQLVAKVTPTIYAQLALPHCRINASYQGQISAQYHLKQQRGEVSWQAPIELLPENNCSSELAWLGDVSGSFQLTAAQGLSIEKQLLMAPLLELQSETRDFQLKAKSSAVDLGTASVSSEVMLELQSSQLGAHQMSAQLKWQANDLEVQGDWHYQQDKLRLAKQFNATEVAAHSQFSVQGDPRKRLTLEADTQLSSQKMALADKVAKELSTTLSLHTEVDIARVGNGLRLHRVLPEGIHFKAEIDSQASALMTSDINAGDNTINATLTLAPNQDFIIDLALGSEHIDWQNTQVKGLQQQLHWSGNLAPGEIFSSFTGNTEIAAISQSDITAKRIAIATTGKQNRGVVAEHAVNIDGIEFGLQQQYSSSQHLVKLQLPLQSLTKLQPYITPRLPDAQVTKGEFSLQLQGDLHVGVFDFNANVQGAEILANEQLLRDGQLNSQGRFSSAAIQLQPSILNIAEIRSGVVLENIHAELSSENNQPRLRNIGADIFAGTLNIDELKLSEQPQRFNVTLDKLSLGLLAEAGRDAGVELQGLISGELAVQASDAGIEITAGEVRNVGEGLLKVQENASINALKQQQPSLKTVITVLDELTIEQLNSGVTLGADGWLDLDVKIAGINKRQQQPVNFNYTHSENVFTLLRALRLSDEITREVEKALNKEER